MPQRRGWRQPKQDHSVYVQQLFRDFLTRNGEIPITAGPNDARMNFCGPKPGVTEQRKQPGIFDRAVYARFERNTNNGSFIRQEPTHRSKTGLMRWIDQQRNNRSQRNVAQKPPRLDDYLNLPGNFFSETDHMKLPFEVADRTIGNVTSNFVPPATSTPFDRMASFGVSGVLSDPEELQSNRPVIQSTSSTTSSIWDLFLKNCEDYLTDVTNEHECTSEWIHQRQEMQTLVQTGEINLSDHYKYRPDIGTDTIPVKTSKHSEIIGEPLANSRDNSLTTNCYHAQNSRTFDLMSLVTPMETHDILNPFPVILDDLKPDQDPMLKKRKKRNNVTFLIDPNSQSKFKTCSTVQTTQKESSQVDDILLTASPPSPNMSSNRARYLYEESTFLLDRMPSDDTLLEKLDALLEEEEFSIHGGITIPDIDFYTLANQPTIDISFPSQLKAMNHPTDDSIVANADFPDTPMYLTQDLTIAPTIQNFQEAMF
ncbi:uncharacterized protein LOC128709037 [Anopheles marshallii]|uniref:uncharacterized protein LOC128709037 n=1 Tax=Anopheles marshallii TaxID=1521116 RepID=UPI00237B1FDE|nr:uncharacterized protein LOC128709037 [Anopheles marshallii]